jgi:surface polysaccharide O-acyltransferase-like enzyme
VGSINILAVFLSAIATMIVGSVWYSPKVFGTLWMKLDGVKQKDMHEAKKEMPKMYAGMFVASLVMAYVLGKFIQMSGLSGVQSGVVMGFWVWLGFIATSLLSMQLANGKPMKLYAIQAGYYLVVLVVIGAILGAMR